MTEELELIVATAQDGLKFGIRQTKIMKNLFSHFLLNSLLFLCFVINDKVKLLVNHDL